MNYHWQCPLATANAVRIKPKWSQISQTLYATLRQASGASPENRHAKQLTKEYAPDL